MNNSNNSTHSKSNYFDKILQTLISCVECICCLPITFYGLYLACKSPSYKYEPILDRPTIEALVDHYI